MQGALQLFTVNSNQWGTAEDEYLKGINDIQKQLERDWGQSEKSEIHIQSFVEFPLDANWAAAVCQVRITTGGKEHIFDHLRGTIIIERENDIWKIAHMHASFPDYRNEAGSSFPLNTKT